MNENAQSMIQRYDSKMQEYCDKVIPGFQKYIDRNKGNYSGFTKRLFDFYLFSSYLVDAGLFEDRPKNEDLLKVLYCKAAVSFFGIYKCFDSGCVSEAMVLTRALFETLVNLKLILESDTAERLRLFDNYGFVSRWLNSIANPEMHDVAERTLIEKQYDNVRGDYHPKCPYHWAWKLYASELKRKNLSLKFICKKLGLMDDYNKVYSALSISVHVNPRVGILYKLKEKFTIAPIYSDGIYLVGCLALGYFKDLIDLVVRYYTFDELENIHLYMDVFHLDLCKDYRKGRPISNVRI
ncbi:hypothetical protein KAW55_01405 [bacterium]|nr:hypothetical protein [bacterium]